MITLPNKESNTQLMLLSRRERFGKVHITVTKSYINVFRMSFDQRQQSAAASNIVKSRKGAPFQASVASDESGNHLYANCEILGLN